MRAQPARADDRIRCPAVDRAALDASRSFERHCLQGFEPGEKVLGERVQRSLMLVTALAPQLGYEEVARIARKAHAENIILREAAIVLGRVSGEAFNA